MEIEQIYGDSNHKILKAHIKTGGKMPRHYATSDAFVIVTRGRAVLIFDDREITLQRETTFLIPDHKPHTLQVLEDFEAYIILAPKAGIELPKSTAGEPERNEINH